MLYSAERGRKLQVAADLQSNIDTWNQQMWPGSGTAVSLKVALSAPTTASVGQDLTITATCTNGNDAGSRYPGTTNTATNAMCAIRGLPEAAPAPTCTPAVPVAALAPGATVSCATTFRPAVAGKITVRADVNSWSFNLDPNKGVATQTITVN